MKKLIVAVAFAIAAIASQAAQVNWTASNIYTPATIGSTSPEKISGAYYMCFLSEDDNGVWTKTISAADAADYAKKGNISKLTEYAVKKGTMTTKGTVSTGYLTGYSGGDVAVTGFIIIFDNGDANLAENFMITAEATTKNFSKDTTTNAVAAGSQANNTWQSIPEPTSGLLMLLGMAGLALRRRRA